MANQCPKCGKPTRPGAKFCGFCSHDLSTPPSAVPPAAPRQAGPAVPQPAPAGPVQGGVFCPHCGKPNRSGVKFCASCGKAIPAAAVPPPPKPVPPPPSPPGQLPESVVGGTPPASPPPKRRRSRKVTIAFLLAVVMVVCVLLAGISYVVGIFDPLFPSEATPTQAEDTPEEDETAPTATLTNTFTPSLTPTDTFTPMLTTEVPGGGDMSPTLAPSPTLTVTASLTPTLTFTPTITNIPESVEVFRDDFQENLMKWDIWHRPLAKKRLGEFIELESTETDTAGITTGQLIHLIPGTSIEFRAEVDDSPGHSLTLDWSPGGEIRSPGEEGPLYLVIGDKEINLHFQLDGVDMNCKVDLRDTLIKIYRIYFGPDWEVELYVDGELQEECSVIINEPARSDGKLSFSGTGLIDYIVVSSPRP